MTLAQFGEIAIGVEALVARVEVGDQNVDVRPVQAVGHRGASQFRPIDQQDCLFSEVGEDPLELGFLERDLARASRSDGRCRGKEPRIAERRGGAAGDGSDETARPFVELDRR